MHRLGSLGCHTRPSDPRVDEQRTATRTKSLLSQLHTGHTGRNTLAVVDLSPKYRTSSFVFRTASYFGLAALGDPRRLQRLLLDHEDSRLDRADGPEQRDRLPSRHVSSLMPYAAVATGGESQPCWQLRSAAFGSCCWATRTVSWTGPMVLSNESDCLRVMAAQ